eukprot:GILI01024818.1.p1 GENE.GILI01024818.1~~GILI01024818.1.p1  ORF type:complete len:117 (+),score=9.72 GILI01024818.1:772-1122(+)
MTKDNYRFAHYASRAPLFELKVEPGTTVGALKELAEKHLSSADNLCPMQYFGKWYCECRVGARTRMMCIEERDNELPLAEAGLEDESCVPRGSYVQRGASPCWSCDCSCACRIQGY